jgi:hypothetical protein
MLCMRVFANTIDTGHYACEGCRHFRIVVAYSPVSVSCLMSVRAVFQGSLIHDPECV